MFVKIITYFVIIKIYIDNYLGDLIMNNLQVLAITIGTAVIGVGGAMLYKNQHYTVAQAKPEKVINHSVAEIDKEMLINRTNRLYDQGHRKLPFMKTISYTHNVHWMPGRSALLSDYAKYYKLSKQFLTRSLNSGQLSESHRKISQGDSFNVIDENRKIEFNLVCDLSRRYLHLYAVDHDLGERYLLRVYKVAVGHVDPLQSSGSATPTGTYKLSRRVGVFKPGEIKKIRGRTLELVQLYGTRYIPFGRKGQHCAIQGNPWQITADAEELVEVRNGIGEYSTEGNIQMNVEDVEELFSIVTCRPTTIQIVKTFREAKLPGREVDL